jgi:sarcosine oxidase subunit beta
MAKTADVVIVGGGIVGLSIAYYLALKKAGKVVLYERGQLGEGSTSRCVGGIRTQFSTEINIRFSLESLKIFEEFEEEFGVAPEFKRIGYLFLATREWETEVFIENVKLQKKFGIPVEYLNSEEIGSRWAYLRVDDVLGGHFVPGMGMRVPMKSSRGLPAAQREQG